mmetsp:Transcript_6655/g.21808  ORF Transcript_6655/g.21808 Transcript_6655/m.21808 type:complete len:347 (-) Transcript_6655:107-1147(-)|eukprot:scaffold34050_cov112-Isochrysis_galbana.AAC.4
MRRRLPLRRGSGKGEPLAQYGGDLRVVAEERAELGHLAEGARVQIGALARLGDGLEHQRLEGVLVLVPVDLHATQHGQLGAVVPDAGAGSDLREHSILDHRVHLVRDEGHVIGRRLDPAQSGAQLHLDVVELQVVHIAKVGRRRGARLAQRLVGANGGAACTGAADHASPLEGADFAVIAHAHVRCEQDEELALIGHMVGVGGQAGLARKRHARQASQCEGLAPPLSHQVDQLLLRKVHLIRAHRVREERVAFLVAAGVERRRYRVVNLARHPGSREELKGIGRGHRGIGQHDCGRQAQRARKRRPPVQVRLQHGSAGGVSRRHWPLGPLRREAHLREPGSSAYNA